MKTLNITKYSDINSIINNKETEILISLDKCDTKTKLRVIDFISGFSCKSGIFKKLKKDLFSFNLKGEINE